MFITSTEFANASMSAGLLTALSGTGGSAIFEEAERRAAAIITDKTGVESPADSDDAPPLLKTIAGMLIYALLLPRVANASEQQLDYARWAWNEAMKLLETYSRPTTIDEAGAHETGTIEGLYS